MKLNETKSLLKDLRALSIDELATREAELKKELFELHDCEWLGLFKDFSNHKFNFKKPVKSRKEKILDFLLDIMLK